MYYIELCTVYSCVLRIKYYFIHCHCSFTERVVSAASEFSDLSAALAEKKRRESEGGECKTITIHVLIGAICTTRQYELI